jgi:hypothetical protein
MDINYNRFTIRLSHEQVFESRGLFDARYRRLLNRVIITQPTEADWADYRKAKGAHDYLLDSPYFEDGGPDERSSVTKPEPKREYIYAETVEEWVARCLEIEKEDAE